MIAAAMLDRLLHRSVVLNIDGDSYRMRPTAPGPKPPAAPWPAHDRQPIRIPAASR